MVLILIWADVKPTLSFFELKTRLSAERSRAGVAISSFLLWGGLHR